MALPPAYRLDAIRALRGKAHVTFPGAKTDVKKVERILTVNRKEWELPYYQEDLEHTGCLLIAQEKLSESGTQVEVYRAWHTLPGVLLIGVENDPETNEQITVTRQLVRNDADLPGNSGGIAWSKQPLDDVIAIHTKRDLSNLLGKDYIDYPQISYTFPGLLSNTGRTLSERSQPASYRAARSLNVRARRRVFFTEAAQEEEIFQWVGVNIRSDAGSFADVLHNLFSVEIGGRRQRVEASEPTAAEYPAGDEVLIEAPSVRGENGLYRNEYIYITLL